MKQLVRHIKMALKPEDIANLRSLLSQSIPIKTFVSNIGGLPDGMMQILNLVMVIKMSDLISISAFRLRRWGKNGTPPSRQAIRNMILRGDLSAEKIGNKWFINWTTYQLRQNKGSGNLVAMVLNGKR